MKPYVSFVAVSRNDNHGEDLNARTQLFISGLIEQAERYRVHTELILVEWNPPIDKPDLDTEFDWGGEHTYFSAKMITVPPALHRHYIHGEAQPLYQMIGKNVGIRRATGRFIAATNIDILFSDKFFKRLAREGLRERRVYVVDRVDVDKRIPQGSMEEKLSYCRKNVLRRHLRHGSYDERTGVCSEIYPNMPRVVQLTRQCWKEAAEIRTWFTYAVREQIYHWCRLRIHESLYLCALAFGRGLCAVVGSLTKRAPSLLVGIGTALRLINKHRDNPRHAGHVLVQRWADMFQRDDRVSQLSLLARQFRENLRRIRADHNEYLRVNRSNLREQYRALRGRHTAQRIFLDSRRNMLRLHTNGVGDLTMMDAASWKLLHAYAEYDTYSMHIDGLVVWQAYAAGMKQVVLTDSPIYHIEHAAGSGYTPENQDKLWDRLTELGVPYLHWESVAELIEKIISGHIDYRLSSKHWGLVDHELRTKILR